MRRCEEEGWEKAKLYKDQCVKEALANANSRTEKEIRKLQKQHEQTLKKETSRVEGKLHALILLRFCKLKPLDAPIAP